ncbi:MAG: hypothetical protein RLZZ360_671 [Candidatus Parcubacteria bacterium]|jgi:hypothetical protein
MIKVMDKVCRYCHKSYPETDFGVAKTVGEKVYRRQKCRYCYRKTKNILKSKRRSIIDERKEELGCERCGIRDVRVLEFHHRDSQTKDFAISDYYYHQFGTDRLNQEIAKCAVLCANCHRILHFEARAN